jgi:UDP-N-acetylmuramate dehydrogenase
MAFIQHDISLKQLNTFGIDVKAKYFASFHSEKELISILGEIESLFKNDIPKLLFLGSGSNILFTKDFDGVVLKNEIEGIQVVHEDEEFVYVTAGAGVLWHDFVLFCVENSFGGAENLSLIPGTVGASPIQNIGAYGVELKDILFSLKALDIKEKDWLVFSNKDCEFGYRTSIFKTSLKDRLVITSATFRLTKKNHTLHLDYGAIPAQLGIHGVSSPSIKDISDAVVAIRSSKLPDPRIIGNAGSFFKNPIVSKIEFDNLKLEFPDIVANETTEGYKLAAGWLIEKAGWKGYRQGDAGCYNKQALVLVNYGQASGVDILDLSTLIIKSVFDKFSVELTAEVNIV